MLQAFSTSAITITGLPYRFDEAAAKCLSPVAPQVLFGVDHIPSRWTAQAAAAGRWLCVGASSHDFVLVSAHPPGEACAGCVHTRDDQTAGEIPTISFVSFWAGLVQALELLAHAARSPAAPASCTHVWPFGLENPHGIHQFNQAPAPRCPVGCAASSARRPA